MKKGNINYTRWIVALYLVIILFSGTIGGFILNLKKTSNSLLSNLSTSSSHVYDLSYNPAGTQLLKEAKRKGCAGVFNGLGMLLYQGVLAFKIWFDVEPPIEVMEEALREVLTK